MPLSSSLSPVQVDSSGNENIMLYYEECSKVDCSLTSRQAKKPWGCLSKAFVSYTHVFGMEWLVMVLMFKSPVALFTLQAL